MKQPLIAQILAGVLAFASTAPGLQAATYTWDGGGSDSNWKTAGNWADGSAPTATGHSLVFSGTNRLDPSNDVVTSLANLTFDAEAGSFVLSGSAFTLTGTLENQGNRLQKIANDISLSGGTNSNHPIRTGAGGLALAGNISGLSALVKTGTGELTLTGANTFTGTLNIAQGPVVLDVAHGGSLSSSASLQFGGGTASTPVSIHGNTNAGGSFEIVGTASGGTSVALNALTISYTAGSNRVIVDANEGDGVLLTTSTLSRTATTTGQPTLNIDLSSSANNRFKTGSIPGTSINGIVNNVLLFATVTTSTNVGGVDVTRTGLAAVTGVDGDYELVRNIPTQPLGASGNSTSVNYKAQDPLTLTANAPANTVTITGSGSVDGNYSLTPGAVLMEEGSGDFTFSNAILGRDNYSLFLHQYSTDGILTIDSSLFGAATGTGGTYSTNTRLIKTGPGTVVLNGPARTLTGPTDFEQGEVRLNGSLAATSVVFVRGGATLSGSGSIGGGATSSAGTTFNYTPLYVQKGGTLDASHNSGDALKINGSLTLYEDANFKLDLQRTAYNALTVTKDPAADGPVVSLDGNLALTLGFAPGLSETITLLKSDTGFSGEFATVNGNAFGPGSTLGLLYHDVSYQFGITYGPASVYLTTLAVPEPASALLLVCCGIPALWFLRRSRLG